MGSAAVSRYTRIHCKMVVFVLESRLKYFNSLFAEQHWTLAAATAAMIMKYFSFSFAQWIVMKIIREKKMEFKLDGNGSNSAHTLSLILGDRMQKKKRTRKVRNVGKAGTPTCLPGINFTFYFMISKFLVIKRTPHAIDSLVLLWDFFGGKTITCSSKSVDCTLAEPSRQTPLIFIFGLVLFAATAR